MLIEQETLEYKLNLNDNSQMHNINDTLEKNIVVKKQLLANKQSINSPIRSSSPDCINVLTSPEMLSVNRSLDNVNVEINKLITDHNTEEYTRDFKGNLLKEKIDNYDDDINNFYISLEGTREKMSESDDEKIEENFNKVKQLQKIKDINVKINGKKIEENNKLGFKPIIVEDQNSEIIISKEK